MVVNRRLAGRRLLDVKTRKDVKPYDGYLFNGEYSTARELGNILFGMNAAKIGLNIDSVMKNAGAYNVEGLGGMIRQNLGIGSNFGAPYFGEDIYSGRNIIYGFNSTTCEWNCK
jgi:hypothetical protein